MRRLRSLAWAVLALSLAPALAFAGGPFDSGLTSSAILIGGTSGSVTCNTSPCLVLGTNTVTTSTATLSAAELSLLDGHAAPLVDTSYGGSLALSDLTTSGYLTASGVYAPSAPSTFAGITTTTIAGTSQTLSGNLVVTGSVTAGSVITGSESGVTLNSPTLAGTMTATGATITGGTFTNTAGIALAGALQESAVFVTAANDLTLPSTGNYFIVSGSTQINAIVATNWAAGSEVTLISISGVTMKYNTDGGAGTLPILLNGAVDYVIPVFGSVILRQSNSDWIEVPNHQLAAATPTMTIMAGYSATRTTAAFGGQYVASTAVIQGVVLTWGVAGSITGNVTVGISCGGGASQTCTSPCNTAAGTPIKCTFGTPVDVLAGTASQVCVFALTDNCSVGAPTLISASGWGHF